MYMSKVIAESLSANAESLRLKEELDQTRARLHDEVSAALKPCKTTGQSNGVAAAWKKVEPLEKAVDTAGADVQRKMTKVSTLLAKLTEDLPLIIQVLQEPEREKELIEKIESLDSELEIAQNESLSLSSEVESLSKLLKESEKEIQQMKDNFQIQQQRLAKQQDTSEKTALRCDNYQKLAQMGSVIIESLENQVFNDDILLENTAKTSRSKLDLDDDQLFQDRETEVAALYEELSALRAELLENQVMLLEAQEEVRSLQDEKDFFVGFAMSALDAADVTSAELHSQVRLLCLPLVIALLHQLNSLPWTGHGVG
jgi:hypothetical protein